MPTLSLPQRAVRKSSSSREPPKKRTLLDHFSLVPNKRKVGNSLPANDNHWLLIRLPTDIHEMLFRLLTVNETNNFSQTCRKAASLVGAIRGPFPHLIKEELLSKRILFSNTILPSPANATVHQEKQVRLIRFLLETRSMGIVEVLVQFSTLFCAETFGHRIHWTHRGAKTDISLRVSRQIKHRNGNRSWVILFQTKSPSLGPLTFVLQGYETQLHSREEAEHRDNFLPSLSVAAEGNLRLSMKSIYKCAERISRSPSHYNFPSLDNFLWESLPPAMHPYLPNGYQLDPVMKLVHPRQGALWKHREPPSPCERNDFFENKWHSGAFAEAYPIHQVPWYRDWYPEKVLLSPHNLLGSLPASIRTNAIAAFLGDADIASLTEVCPTLSPGRVAYH